MIRAAMRKLLLAFLLPVFLLLSQQGAMQHELGHLSAELKAPGSSTHAPGDLQCEACLAFAHLAGIATTQVPPPALLSFGFHLALVDAPAFIAADAPSARSRGPPTVL